MRHKITILALLVMVSLASLCIRSNADAPASVTVSTNSVMILPARPIKNAVIWTANTTYPQGATVKQDDRYYWAVVGGVSTTTAPTHVYGDAIDNTVTWRKIEKGDRSRWVATVNSTNNVYFSIGFPAVLNKGIRLNASGGALSLSDGCSNDPVFAIAAETNNVVCVQEMTEK